MKTRLTFLFLVIIAFTFGQTNQELEYLETRNNFIDQYKSLLSDTLSKADWAALDQQMEGSLLVLEVKLREIMKGSKFDSIPINGKISLSSLLESKVESGSWFDDRTTGFYFNFCIRWR